MKRKPTLSDVIDGGAYLDVDGEVLTIHQPHMTSNDPDAPYATVVTAWPHPGMPESIEKYRFTGTLTARQVARQLRALGAARITVRWQD